MGRSADTEGVRTALGATELAAVDELLAASDAAYDRRFPGEAGTRRPVHTAYVSATEIGPEVVRDWGRAALDALHRHGPDPASMLAACGFADPGDDPAMIERVYADVVATLDRRPIEDLRIDFEDGYVPSVGEGRDADAAEDADASAAARAVLAVAADARAPAWIGIRFKSLERPTRRRGLRTLDLVLATILAEGDLPPGWLVTLPKVTSVAQVTAMVAVCERLEAAHGLVPGRLRFELQVETPQAVLGPDGAATIAPMIHAARGRCEAIVYGTYDYSAALGITPSEQAMDHPVADHALVTMMLAAACTGVRVSHGSTNVLPVGDRDAVHAAWRLHARLVRRSLRLGVYQGWDLHPAQLPTRYLSTYAFFRAGLPAAAGRLRDYVSRTGSGELMDEPATARTLATSLLRTVDVAGIGADEMLALTGLPLAVVEQYARRRRG